MAKANKRPKTRSNTKPIKSKAKAVAPPQNKAGKTQKAKVVLESPRGTRGARQSTEVESTWREYWQCRTELETAVTAVREAEKSLASARDLERTCREAFDRTKNSLKSLLEVEPASGERPGSFDLTGKGLSLAELDDEALPSR